MEFGERLKELRSSLNYSQKELSEKTGLTLRTIQRIENNKVNPSLHSVKVIGEALKIDLSEFSKQSDTKPYEFNLTFKITDMNEFTTGNVAIYIGPTFEIGGKMNLSLGLVENYLINPEFKTATGTIDIRKEIKNYTTLFFDIRKSIYKEVNLGIRYEWGLNSMFKKIDSKVTNISFNMFLPLKGGKNQEKD
jgi:transcriptional regulator with XRE-family HTH domain